MSERQRVDKWLWHTRFFKTRALAQKMIESGHLRINSQKTRKPAALVGVGDVLTFVQARNVRVVKVLGMLNIRTSAPIAQEQYEEIPLQTDEGAH